MERVAFLVESSGATIRCLLNPESLLVQRHAGVAARQTVAGQLAESGLADDPLMFTGGGRTELEFELLFDIELTDRPWDHHDVRELTRPLWQLAENSVDENDRRRPPAARFIWGKAWNVPGVVTEVAERFDVFNASGMPLRSWVKMRFVRIGESADSPGGEMHDYFEYLASLPPQMPPTALPASTDVAASDDRDPVRVSARGLGMLSDAAFGLPAWWKPLLAYNGIDDPLSIDVDEVLRRPGGGQ